MTLILLIVLAAMILMLAYMRFEAGNLDVVEVDLSGGGDSLKVVLLSDIHMRRLKISAQEIADVIEKQQPDMIMIAGDYIESVDEIPGFLDFLRTIRNGKPMYMCLGNHDYLVYKNDKAGLRRFIDAIHQTEAVILENRCVSFKINKKKYNIIGLSELHHGHPDIARAFKDASKDASLTLVLSHNPEIALSLANKKIDYLFCGHFHGGQIWMPFHLEFRTMRTETISKMGMRRGLHKIHGMHLYISRGLGNVKLPIRFLSRPELTVFKLPAI